MHGEYNVKITQMSFNTWHKIVISLDKLQPIVLKIMDIQWQKHGVANHIQRCKQISTNKFEYEFEFIHFSFKQFIWKSA
jgi:hypothetical protein